MNLHHSDDPRLWNLDAELRLLGLHGAPMTRREALKLGLLGSAGAFFTGCAVTAPNASRVSATPLPAIPRPLPQAVVAKSRTPAKSVIQIWLWGGPCHLDTFDPKPDAGNDYAGPLRTPL